MTEAEEIARSLPIGAALEGVTAIGKRIVVTVLAVEGASLEIEGDDAIIEIGMPVTLRVPDDEGVSFIQLVAERADATRARLMVIDALRVSNERSLDRSSRRLTCRIVDARFGDETGEVFDSSAVGIRVQARWPVAPGDALPLQIEMPDGEPVAMTVHVRRTRPLDDGRLEFAGEVLALTPGDWSRLEAVR